MRTKRCCYCKQTLPTEMFGPNRSAKDGISFSCRECTRAYNRKHRKKHLEKYRERSRKYGREHAKRAGERSRKQREDHPEERKEYLKKYYKEHLAEFKEYDAKRYRENPERHKELNKAYRKAHPEEMAKYYKEYYKEHLDDLREYHRKYGMEHREKRNESGARYMKRNRLASAVSGAVRRSLKGQKEGRSWRTLVDYSLLELKAHLEEQFDKDMTWKNYGKYWHIDHIIPMSLWRFTIPEDGEFKQCWALANLQPLEAVKNIRKGNRCTN